MNSIIFSVGLAAMLMGGLVGCASSRSTSGATSPTSTTPTASTPPVAPKPSKPDFGTLEAQPQFTIRKTSDNSVVTLKQLIETVANTDIVLVGEIHGQPHGQAFELELFRETTRRTPTVAAALEFFERDEQADLDDYVTKLTDEETFLKATNRTPGNYTPGHRAIVELSRHIGRPVIAANAPRHYVRLARTEGYEKFAGLTESQNQLFKVPEKLPEGPYQDRFMDLMAPKNEAGERPDQKKATEMFRSQAMWDATMADSVVWGFNKNQGLPIMLFVGGFHVEYGGGLVHFLKQQLPTARVVTLAMVEEGNPGIPPPANAGPIADYVVELPAVTGEGEPSKAQ